MAAEPTIEERIAATRRPDAVAVMRQRWAELLFLHWTVPAAELQALLPRGLDLDTYDGRAWVGLVPFRLTGVRLPFTPPLPGLSAFDEVNVRTYVHHAGHQPGVWFFSLDASSRLAVVTARALFKLAYHHAEVAVGVEARRVTFASRRRMPGPSPARCSVRYEPLGKAAPAAPGTLEHFLVERYILYAAHGGRLYRGRVHHEPYPVQGATVDGLEEDLVAAAQIRRPTDAPLAHYASEVNVEIFPLTRV